MKSTITPINTNYDFGGQHMRIDLIFLDVLPKFKNCIFFIYLFVNDFNFHKNYNGFPYICFRRYNIHVKSFIGFSYLTYNSSNSIFFFKGDQ